MLNVQDKDLEGLNWTHYALMYRAWREGKAPKWKTWERSFDRLVELQLLTEDGKPTNRDHLGNLLEQRLGRSLAVRVSDGEWAAAFDRRRRR